MILDHPSNMIGFSQVIHIMFKKREEVNHNVNVKRNEGNATW